MLRGEADGLMRRERPNLNVEIHLVSVAAIPGERFSRPRSGVSKIERNFRAIHCFLVLVRSQRWLAAKKKKKTKAKCNDRWRGRTHMSWKGNAANVAGKVVAIR